MLNTVTTHRLVLCWGLVLGDNFAAPNTHSSTQWFFFLIDFFLNRLLNILLNRSLNALLHYYLPIGALLQVKVEVGVCKIAQFAYLFNVRAHCFVLFKQASDNSLGAFGALDALHHASRFVGVWISSYKSLVA